MMRILIVNMRVIWGYNGYAVIYNDKYNLTCVTISLHIQETNI